MNNWIQLTFTQMPHGCHYFLENWFSRRQNTYSHCIMLQSWLNVLGVCINFHRFLCKKMKLIESSLTEFLIFRSYPSIDPFSHFFSISKIRTYQKNLFHKCDSITTDKDNTISLSVHGVTSEHIFPLESSVFRLK